MKSFLAVLFLVALSLLILGAIFYFMFVYKETTEEFVSLAQLERFQNSAEAYKRRLLDYQNVCQELGISNMVICTNNKEAYRMISKKDGNGSYYCADSTGFLGEVDRVQSGTLQCVWQ